MKKAKPAVQRLLDGAYNDKDGLHTLEEVRAHPGSAVPSAKRPEVAPTPKPKTSS